MMAASDLASLGSKSAGSLHSSVSSALAAALVDDAYEQNDTRATASNLGTLSANKTVNGLVQADANDWYRFTTTGKGASTANVSLTFLNSQGDLDLELYGASGQRLKASQSTANSERVSLSGLTAGTYYLRVYGYQGATNPRYSLSVNLGTATLPAATLKDDAHEQNDTLATAANLGTLSTNAGLSNLVLADSDDWFRFTTTATGGSANVVSLSFQNSQGNLALQLVNASGRVLATSNTTGNSERVSLAGLGAGTYFARVYSATGATNPNYSLQIVAPVRAASPPAAGGFDIQIVYSGFTASQRAIFERAAAKWEAIIVGDLPNATYNGVAVDDLLIHASSAVIDGVNGVLGQAGYDRLRSSGTRLPYHGNMEFDSADLASMEANGSLFNVIVHEMGHVLGIGTLWQSRGLLVGAGTSNPLYTGAQAVAAYNGIFGTRATGVPVESGGGSGTRDAHWGEATFRTEIMTGFINSGSSPLSRITIASLADLGYSVSYARADLYSPPTNSTLFVSGTSTSNGASVQASASRSNFGSILGQALSEVASTRRFNPISHSIEGGADSVSGSNVVDLSSTAKQLAALDWLFAGEANFGGNCTGW
ncbi:pre-peptidase C-terminal domain-containing protein [Anatilimnocola aggregata]|nr:pre-peptidase C-terminal domain-containing protein [Anatilimnocola aggregata]